MGEQAETFLAWPPQPLDLMAFIFGYPLLKLHLYLLRGKLAFSMGATKERYHTHKSVGETVKQKLLRLGLLNL